MRKSYGTQSMLRVEMPERRFCEPAIALRLQKALVCMRVLPFELGQPDADDTFFAFRPRQPKADDTLGAFVMLFRDCDDTLRAYRMPPAPNGGFAECPDMPYGEPRLRLGPQLTHFEHAH